MIDFIVFAITIILRWSLSESAGHFWWPAECENVANPDLENLKKFQNPRNLFLTAPSISDIPVSIERKVQKIFIKPENLISQFRK